MVTIWTPAASTLQTPQRACPIHGFGALHGFHPALGKIGVGEWMQPPSGYNFPDVKQYGRGLVNSASAALESEIYDTLTPPIQQHLGSIKLVVQGITNIRDIVTLLGSNQATLDQKIMAVLTGVVALLEGALDLVESALGASNQAAAQVVANAVATVQAVGVIIQYVAAVVGQILEGIRQREQAKANADQCLAHHLQAHCRALITAHTPWPTGPKSTTTPADIFRQVAYRFHEGKSLPMNVGAMYVLLCGGETQGFGFSRPEYDKFLAEARKHDKKQPEQGNNPVGVPPYRQRVMWTLIKGMMTSISPAGITQAPLIGDSGRSIMPMLQDMVREEWFSGHITSDILQRMGQRLGKEYRLKTLYDGCTCVGPEFRGCDPCYPHATCYVRYGNCGEQRGLADQLGAALAGTIVKGIRDWNNDLRHEFQSPPGSGNWTIGPSDAGKRAAISRLPKNFTLAVPESLVTNNARDIWDAGVRYTQREHTLAHAHHKAAALTTAAVTGGAAFWMARQFAMRQ